MIFPISDNLKVLNFAVIKFLDLVIAKYFTGVSVRNSSKNKKEKSY